MKTTYKIKKALQLASWHWRSHTTLKPSDLPKKEPFSKKSVWAYCQIVVNSKAAKPLLIAAMSYYQYMVSVYRSCLPQLNRSLRSSSVSRSSPVREVHTEGQHRLNKNPTSLSTTMLAQFVILPYFFKHALGVLASCFFVLKRKRASFMFVHGISLKRSSFKYLSCIYIVAVIDACNV